MSANEVPFINCVGAGPGFKCPLNQGNSWGWVSNGEHFLNHLSRIPLRVPMGQKQPHSMEKLQPLLHHFRVSKRTDRVSCLEEHLSLEARRDTSSLSRPPQHQISLKALRALRAKCPVLWGCQLKGGRVQVSGLFSPAVFQPPASLRHCSSH